MAGYALGFDDGGAIPDDDTTGSTPQGGSDQGIPEDESAGLDTRARAPAREQSQAQSQGNDEPGFMQNNFNEAQRGVTNAKRFIGYLMGYGAAAPQEGLAAAAQAKAADPSMSDDDANLLAVQNAGQQGGPEAAWKLLQYNRTAYNAKQAFANAALNGTDGKPSDINAAAQAATQASSHVLDGSQTKFVATGPDAVTATVKGAGGDTQSFQLNGQQFAQLLNLGGEGMYDRVLGNGGMAGTLKAITSGQQGQDQGGQSQGQAQAGAPSTPPAVVSGGGRGAAEANLGAASPPADADDSEAGEKEEPESAYSKRIGRLQNGYRPLDYDAFQDPSSSLAARAAQLYPHVNARDAAARAQYMVAGENRDTQNEAAQKKAETEGKYRVAAEQTRGQYGVQREGTKQEGQVSVHAQDNDARMKRAQLNAQSKEGIAARRLQADVQHWMQVNQSKLDDNARKAIAARMTNVNAALSSGGTEDVANATKEMNNFLTQLRARGLSVPTGQAAAAPTSVSTNPSGNAPVTVNSPAEAHKLAPGTVYMTPDGRKFTR